MLTLLGYRLQLSNMFFYSYEQITRVSNLLFVQVFSIFDGDGNGQIDFKEFVLALWNFCACSDSALRIFAFDLYDNDTSGKLEIEEVEHMLRDGIEIKLNDKRSGLVTLGQVLKKYSKFICSLPLKV